MPALPGVPGLEIVRHYNSAYSKPGNRTGSIGRGWRLSYETEVFDKYVTWTNGRRLHLNARGKLDRITAPTGETLVLLYDSVNVLVRVIDPLGRSLNLSYFDAGTRDRFHGVQLGTRSRRGSAGTRPTPRCPGRPTPTTRAAESSGSNGKRPPRDRRASRRPARSATAMAGWAA